ncbi:MAG: TraR/DksA family transcriptional regulator [Spirochaetales bacterium]|jgi:RNA polymerase-binding protein DksA|nr:TraR/DksA family transcriptional regulator [Spirochaetales bacterium]
MDKRFLKKMRESLESLKKEIIEKLVTSSSEFREILEDMDPKDLVDIAADDIDRNILEALGSQELKRLKAIEAALSRIENNRYGLCVKCNKKIPTERLTAIPYALMCIGCKTSDERRNR